MAKKKKRTTGRKAAEKSAAKKPAAAKRSPKSRAARSNGARQPKVLTSRTFTGDPKKLAKDSYPEDGAAKDFYCYGPAATSDGDFSQARICDMGCFTQDGKDSNKYYHGAVVQHRKSKNWYAYFEWGRTGARSRSFQFVACCGEEDARAVFAKQMHTKNDKRGEWVTIAGIRTLRALKGKDCYLVRPMATRTTGLPDARNVQVSRQRAEQASSDLCDSDSYCESTMKLLGDLRKATIAYTRKSMADSSIPTQNAIDEARAILDAAQARVVEVEDDIDAQVRDKKLMQLTRLMFSRIPRRKKVGAPAATWMLSSANIEDWHDDLDAFESALQAIDDPHRSPAEIMAGMELEMCWIDPASKVGEFLHGWCPGATVNRHRKIGQMSIRNVWTVAQSTSTSMIPKAQQKILKRKIKRDDTPNHQPRSRVDLPSKQRKQYKDSHTALLFHGTRGVNVSAILRDALRMPATLAAVVLTGAKFGPGIYFSDDWKKAADYSNAKGSAEAGRKGAVRGRGAFLFIADVVLGTPYVAESIQGFAKPPRGHHSVFGKAGHSGVDDNELVVYTPDQCNVRYLVEFDAT